MKDWLVEHGIVKSDAQLEREKLQKLMTDNYVNAKDTVWETWRDSDMREWLTEHGYVKSDAQKTRDQLVALMHDKCVFLIRAQTQRADSHLLQVQRLLHSHRPLPGLERCPSPRLPT